MYKLFIKNMVCPRCIRVVREELERLHISVEEVRLGEVLLAEPLHPEQRQALIPVLEQNGFELLDQKEEQLVARVKQLVIQHLWESKKKPAHLNFSDYLIQQTHSSYPQLSRLFSALTGITIEQYLIQMKVERIKELLYYDELTISEIAARLEYSSSQHLSAQFRKVTGMTPTAFRKLKESRDRTLDEW